MQIAGSYHQVDGMRLHCSSAGDGEPLLLVHGFLVSGRCWERVLPGLAERFAVTALDLPGHGASDRPDDYPYTISAFADTVHGLLDTLGLRKVRLLGHSMGGAVALALAAHYPERVSRLVLVNAMAYPFKLPLSGRLALLPGVGEPLFNRLYSKRDMRRYFEKEVYQDPATLDPETLQFYWECFNRPGGRRAMYRTLTAISRLKQLQGLPGQVRCPALVVWGERDRIFPLDHARRLERELSRGTLVTLPDAGHPPPEERPEAFLQAVLPFLSAPEPE
jgi:pimeloyl-ACP methyl ester carboxylesterase